MRAKHNPSQIKATAFAGALVLGLGLYIAACGCTDVGCWSGVTISGPIDILTKAPAHLSIHVCRNGACKDVTLDSDSIMPPSNLTQVNADVGDGVFGCQLIDFGPAHPSWHLNVVFAPDSDGDLEDGDAYVLRVVTDTQRQIVDINQAVQYTEVEPNGTFCGPSCDAATIDIPPLTP